MDRLTPASPLPPFPHRLDGRIALVTGGASGLGAAIASRLAGYCEIVTVGGPDRRLNGRRG